MLWPVDDTRSHPIHFLRNLALVVLWRLFPRASEPFRSYEDRIQEWANTTKWQPRP